MRSIVFSKKSVVLLLVIASVGIVLSLVSVRYSSYTAEEISRIASVDVRSNAQIESHDLSQILLHTLESLSDNLRSLANSQPILNGDVDDGNMLLNNTQASTSELTEGYYWIDQDGKIVAGSSQYIDELSSSRDFSLSDREFYAIPKTDLVPYYSNAIDSPGTVPKLYISYPIISAGPNNAVDRNGTNPLFGGVMVAVVNLDSLGAFLQNEISPEFMSNVGLMDKNGTILYARNQSLVGKNYQSDDFQSTVPYEVKSEYIDILTRSLAPFPGAEEITFNGTTTTISFQPIEIDGRHIWTLFLGSPHSLATDVGILIEQQKNLSSQTIIIIALIAVILAVLILSWNRRLEVAVHDRAIELKSANDSLAESNRLLARTNEQLQTHDRMQKEFIDIAAHELRTPILPILDEAERLSQRFHSNENRILVRDEQIKSIINNAKRLDRLASDILDVTRIESNTLKLTKEKFDIHEIFQRAIRETTERQLDRKTNNAQIRYEPFHCVVSADKSRIFQVVTNLLDNAVKFTEKGIISVSLSGNNKRIEVEVRDSGSGIDNQILPKLFSKFVTTSENGTGLGLYISKRIVEAHGGTIWAQNNKTEGATFRFAIPLY